MTPEPLARFGVAWDTDHPVSDLNEFPDVFADSLNVSSGPYGFTLTLFASEPPAVGAVDEETPTSLGRIVGRVRLAPELVEDLVPLLVAAIENNHSAVAARKVSQQAAAEESKS